jgi:hypothetical protein
MDSALRSRRIPERSWLTMLRETSYSPDWQYRRRMPAVCSSCEIFVAHVEILSFRIARGRETWGSTCYLSQYHAGFVIDACRLQSWWASFRGQWCRIRIGIAQSTNHHDCRVIPETFSKQTLHLTQVCLLQLTLRLHLGP